MLSLRNAGCNTREPRTINRGSHTLADPPFVLSDGIEYNLGSQARMALVLLGH